MALIWTFDRRDSTSADGSAAPIKKTYGLQPPNLYTASLCAFQANSSTLRLMSQLMHADYLSSLRNMVRNLQPSPTARHNSKQYTFIFKDLATSSHVFLRDCTVGGALKPAYSGPHKVIQRGDKVFKILVHGKQGSKNTQLVDYSSTDSDTQKVEILGEPCRLDATIKRPVIYSSESDVSLTDEAFIMNQSVQFQSLSYLNSSSEDENRDPLTNQQEQGSPTKKKKHLMQ
ncbi:unnamed protein product [Pieris brassicae]|uniref:Uncharacterized protein n=1 Tax=Pieris brassicae TaxID=7116 RepID=A0A9P0TQM3_PIEBR|nr:unnamed protein product [Pieris brassicae]